MLSQHRPRGELLPTDQTPQSITTLNNGQTCTEPSTPAGRFSLLKHLKSDCGGHDLDLSINDITTWISAMELTPHGSREKHLTEVLLNVDCACDSVRVPGGKELADHGQRSKNPRNEHPEKSQRPKSKPTHVRKRQSKGKRSRTSDRESESSYLNPYFVLSPDTVHVSMLACPFIKRNPGRYVYVSNSCTERFGFPTPGKLV
jgi:hypothetical protein